MTNHGDAGPDPEEITDWITGTYADTVIAEALGATFFSLDEKHWPNLATIVTTDEHDVGSPSNVSARSGVFRLNIGVGRERFEHLVGRSSDADYAALDTFVPHPVYAKQRWIGILNPSRRMFDEVVKPLIAEAHDSLASTRARRRTPA